MTRLSKYAANCHITLIYSSCRRAKIFVIDSCAWKFSLKMALSLKNPWNNIITSWNLLEFADVLVVPPYWHLKLLHVHLFQCNFVSLNGLPQYSKGQRVGTVWFSFEIFQSWLAYSSPGFTRFLAGKVPQNGQNMHSLWKKKTMVL